MTFEMPAEGVEFRPAETTVAIQAAAPTGAIGRRP
jgi:hypothetical protein